MCRWWAFRVLGAGLACLLLQPNSLCAQEIKPEVVASQRNLKMKALKDFTQTDLAEYIRQLHQRTTRDQGADKPRLATPAEWAAKAAYKAVGQPYQLGASMFTHRQSDCVTLVEQSLAMGLADSWDSYHRIIARLRFAGGVLSNTDLPFAAGQGKLLSPEFMSGARKDWAATRAVAAESFTRRNHFIEADWNRNNQWCLEDITQRLGGDKPVWAPMRHVVRRKAFFAKQGFSVDVPNEVVEDAYIPRDAVPGILSELKDGDVVEVIVGEPDNLHCNHMGIIILAIGRDIPEGPVSIIHSSRPKVKEEPLLMFLWKFRQVRGFKFLRLRADAEQAAARESEQMAKRLVVHPPASE